MGVMLKKWGAPILALGISGCLGSSVPERQITLSDDEWSGYWLQLESRWPVFFSGQCVPAPDLPSMNDVRERVVFLEVPAEWLETCSYRRSSREIRIGDDKWESGCVPHELGHAACHVLGLRVCFDFEHRGYKSQC